MARVILCGVLALCAFGQPQDRFHFEVASIRPVGHDVPRGYTSDPGRIAISRISLREMIANGYPEYGLFGERISGPLWIESEYSLAATLPAGSAAKDVPQMYQNVLTERFGLKFHSLDKDVQGFDLMVSPGGLKLTPSPAKVENPSSTTETSVKAIRRDRDGTPIMTGQGTWGMSWDHEAGVERTSFHECSMKQLAGMLTMEYGERSVPVLDKTEIKGLFSFRLVLPAPSVTVLPPYMAARFGVRPSDSADASVVDLRGVSGSLEKQTGLRLRAVKLTVRAMVIDSVARTPSEN